MRMLEILPRELSSEAWLLTSSGGSVRLCSEGLHDTSYELELFLVRLSRSLTDLLTAETSILSYQGAATGPSSAKDSVVSR